MAGGIAGIPELIERGRRFTFANVGPKSQYGTPNALSDEWLIWTHHVSDLVEELGKSPIRKSIEDGLNRTIIGSAEYAFAAAAGLILNGLQAADKVFGPAIPASDRTVSLGHNSPEQAQALEQIDKLVAAVTETNDFPGEPEDKEQVLAELSAGRKLLEAARVRVLAIRETLQPALRWILEKGAGAAIGKMAGDLWEYLVHLKF
jgi:hypothetical protein